MAINHNFPLKNRPPLTRHYGDGRSHANYFVEGMNWTGHCFTRISSESFAGLYSQIITKIQPGMPGQCNTHKRELAKRIVKGCAWTVVLLASVPFGIIGSILRAIATTWRGDFTMRSGKHPQHVFDGKKLTIMTYNVAWMPEFVAAHNQLHSSRQRMRQLSKRLGPPYSGHTLPDVLCLQEAFHTGCAKEFAKNLVKQGQLQHVVYNIGVHRTGLSSGLLLASKYPIERVKAYPHRLVGGRDKEATKCLLAATLRLGPNQVAHIFTTHLNGGAGNPNGDVCRAQQIHDIERNMQQYKSETPNTEQVVFEALTGDFNIGPLTASGQPDPEWDAHKGFFQTDNLNFIPKDQEDNGTTYDQSVPVVCRDYRFVNSWARKKERVDHILVPNKGKVTGDLVLDPMGGLSDHVAVEGTLTLNQQ